MRPVKFTFSGYEEHVFEGKTDDTYWNGFLNVRVSPEERAKIADLLEKDDLSSADDIRAIKSDRNGLVDLGGGFATSEVLPALRRARGRKSVRKRKS